jgi:hypothetical protein
VADDPGHDEGGDEALERAIAAMERAEHGKKAAARIEAEAEERERASHAVHPPTPTPKSPTPQSEEERIRARLEAALEGDDEAEP